MAAGALDVVSHSIDIHASAECVYRHYADLTSWPVWDPAVAEVSLPSGLEAGSAGWMRTQGGPRMHVRILEKSDRQSFTVASQLPGCMILFGHTLTATGAGVRVTHTLSFAGPLAFGFRRLLGTKIASTLPAALSGLKHVSEADARS